MITIIFIFLSYVVFNSYFALLLLKAPLLYYPPPLITPLASINLPSSVTNLFGFLYSNFNFLAKSILSQTKV